MHWLAIYDWLVNQGLWKALVSWVVIAVMTALVGWRPWRKFRKTQREIADNLDTSTPGGLTDVMHAVDHLTQEIDDETDS